MHLPPLTIAPGAGYWQSAARGLLDALPLLIAGQDAAGSAASGAADLSPLRVVVPTLGHAKLLYYLGVQYDITAQVRAEEEIKRLTGCLESLAK